VNLRAIRYPVRNLADKLRALPGDTLARGMRPALLVNTLISLLK
jgi:hypothetical protein